MKNKEKITTKNWVVICETDTNGTKTNIVVDGATESYARCNAIIELYQKGFDFVKILSCTRSA